MDDSHPSESVIRIARTSPNDIGMRGLEIFVDGEYAANVGFGKTVDIPVTAGHHEIKATNSLYTQKDEFDIASGEIRLYDVCNEAGGMFAFMTVIGGVGPYKLKMEHVGSRRR